jgi:ribonucleoside-diphosphate reductase alpha chain
MRGVELLSKIVELNYSITEDTYDKVVNVLTDAAIFPDADASTFNKLKLYYKEEITEQMKNKQLVPSMRLYQWQELILKNHTKLFNCAGCYLYSLDAFAKIFYLLLCGCGVGVSLRKKFVSKLPNLPGFNKPYFEFSTERYVIQDSIEGWADAIASLMEKFFNGTMLYFDYSKIRPAGSLIAGRFVSTGYKPLENAITKIKEILMTAHNNNQKQLTTLQCYDILMHLASAVKSGGVRRSAVLILMDKDDKELINAKTGNWFETNPQRAYSNNSIGLLHSEVNEEVIKELISKNNGMDDVGLLLVKDEDEITNPCAEIRFNFFKKIKNKNKFVAQFCNLTEFKIDALFSITNNYSLVRLATILGTLQSGFTNHSYLGPETIKLAKEEPLLGVSMTNIFRGIVPDIFDSGYLIHDLAEYAVETNKKWAELLGIQTARRITTVKPSGNTSALLMSSNGIHPDFSRRYFRVVQIGKITELGKYLEKYMPDFIEESVYNKQNYALYIPIYSGAINRKYLSNTTALEHLNVYKEVYKNWVEPGSNGSFPNSISITLKFKSNEIEEIAEEIANNKNIYTGIAFMRDDTHILYPQSPITLIDEYKDSVVFNDHYEKMNKKWNYLNEKLKDINIPSNIKQQLEITEFTAKTCNGNGCML